MLVEDTTAFIEHLEVQRGDRRVEKHRRRLARAELDVMRLEVEARLADQALRAAARELAASREQPALSPGRRLVRDRRERSLVRELTSLRNHLRESRENLQRARERMQRLRREQPELDGAGRWARMIRLHSAQHHLEYSERRFARLARHQSVRPVLVGKHGGRRWWWYADRFWWDDARLSARQIETLVVRADHAELRRADELTRARRAILGEERTSVSPEGVSPVVRFAVWCRDRGSCVDCGTRQDVGYDRIVPFSKGGWRWIANVELRCARCSERRAHNETRTRVGRARVDATSQLL
jgi:hypothetical protein